MSAYKEKNHPIVIGVGQITHREKIQGNNVTAVDLAVRAISECAADTGRPDILKLVDAISVVFMMAEYPNRTAPRICKQLGISPPIQEETAVGGNYPQWLVNRAADKIMAGELKIALLAGGEALYQDVHFQALLNSGPNALENYSNDRSILGDTRLWSSPHEFLYGADYAVHIYPLFENALRANLGLSIREHRALMNSYMNKMAEAAKGNPYAWFDAGKGWENIAEPTKENPIFNFPYTKFLNPIPAVNQAAAVLVTDTKTARKLGIPQDKWVYLHGGADTSDKWYISERVNYHSSPAVRYTTRAALKSAGLQLSDISFFDLYSCFPCAVYIAAREIGLSIQDPPPLSITGGLSFFGGPGSNYTMHSIAHAVERLRKTPDEYGFVTGVGNNMTKYSVGIYSGIEPAKPWGRESESEIFKKIAALESPVFCEQPNGPATVETYTVLHDRPDRKPHPIIIARLDSGERCLATASRESAFINRMETEEFIGYKGFVKMGEAGLNVFN